MRRDGWALGRIGAVAALLVLAGTGCGLLRHSAVGMVAPVTDNLALALQQETDLQLVHDGVPAFILLLDGLALSAPDNAQLQLAAADAYTAYGTAFVDPAEKVRTGALFGKARAYGLRVLSRNRRFAAALHGPLPEYEAAVASFRKRDVPALYSTATAWAGWIISQSDSMEAIAQLSRALALMQRVLDLDRGYRNGGADQFFGIYYCIQPRGAGQNLPKAREHFERAMECAGPDFLLTRVTFAEFYARYTLDRDLFERTLREVVAHPDTRPEFGLMNAVARKRAQDLLARADDLF